MQPPALSCSPADQGGGQLGLVVQLQAPDDEDNEDLEDDDKSNGDNDGDEGDQSSWLLLGEVPGSQLLHTLLKPLSNLK